MNREKNRTEKEKYIQYFQGCKKYIKFNAILEECSIKESNFSQFINKINYDAISIEKLDIIKSHTINVINELIK